MSVSAISEPPLIQSPGAHSSGSLVAELMRIRDRHRRNSSSPDCDYWLLRSVAVGADTQVNRHGALRRRKLRGDSTKSGDRGFKGVAWRGGDHRPQGSRQHDVSGS